MTSKEILEKYLDFYKQNGHKQIPNVSLIPENDPTLLFVNSGMFPLVPYLSGEKHPQGKRLLNVQRCLRMDDLDEIGDKIHTLAFHMIGNWSLGDYGKKEQLTWKFEFFMNVLKLDPRKIAITLFAGDSDAPKDAESVSIVKDLFEKYGVNGEIDKNIWLYSKKQGNWWQRGDAIGELGGPSCEIFYYLGGHDSRGLSPEDHELDFVEMGNSVFMEYKKTESGWEKLSQANVDYGGGLERIAMAVQSKKDIFETDNFYPIVEKIEEMSGKKYLENVYEIRNIADHIRDAVFMAMDGVVPSNKEQGYILRRVLRRMVRFGKKIGIEKDISVSLVPVVVEMFSWMYPDLVEKQESIRETFSVEEEKFRNILNRVEPKVISALEKSPENIADLAFDFYQSQGFPVEMFVAIAKEKGIDIDENELEKRIEKHKAQSRLGAEGKFKGGLADQSENTVRYHTATHLLHKALRDMFGDDIVQQGSNITGERLRFDFNFDRKLTGEEISKIEDAIYRVSEQALPVRFEIMSQEEAKKLGAIGTFGEKYGDQVKVYFVGDSKELCGGPHVKNTKDIGHIKIYKQDKIGEGEMRIYARVF